MPKLLLLMVLLQFPSGPFHFEHSMGVNGCRNMNRVSTREGIKPLSGCSTTFHISQKKVKYQHFLNAFELD